MITLLDTSALGKLMVEEEDSPALRSYLAAAATQADLMCISSLAATELRRMSIRLDIGLDRCQPILERFGIIRLTEAMLHQAGTFPQRQLRTLDTIHIATAIAIEAGALITYDERQASAATDEGLSVGSPR